MPSTCSTSDIFVYLFGLCFVVNRYSYVRLRPLPHSTIISSNLALIEPASVAIWNRHKVAVGMAIGTWGIYLMFLIQGMSFTLHPTAGHVYSCKGVFLTGAARVRDKSQLFWILSPQLIRSCALNGWLPSSPV